MCMAYRLQQRHANDEDTNSLTNTLQIELLFHTDQQHHRQRDAINSITGNVKQSV